MAIYFSKTGSVLAVCATMIAAQSLGGCIVDQYKPAVDMTGKLITTALSGNTVVSDVEKTIPGAPATVLMRTDGSVVGVNLLRRQDGQSGAWKVNSGGYLCVKWPNWESFQCGYVRDYQNGEYFWRGSTFKILPGNPQSL